MEKAEVAPETKAKIRIKVKKQDGNELFFLLNAKLKFKRLYDIVSKKWGIDRHDVRLLFDGERISEDHTPEGLEIKDEDEIDCMYRQIGGAGSESM